MAESATERPTVSRMDKFGSYGKQVVEKSVAILPDANKAPVMTRDLVRQLENAGVQIRGENKVNALSAILARSSKLKAHGRRGWTRAESVAGSDAHTENDPSSVPAVGSDTADEGAPPPNSASEHSNSPASGS